jgi:hypothetical protein
MYLLLHNEKIRDVIDTITSKVVLILGRFTAERKAVLDALRDELRNHNYLAVLFDFDKSASQNHGRDNNVARAHSTVRDCRYLRPSFLLEGDFIPGFSVNGNLILASNNLVNNLMEGDRMFTIQLANADYLQIGFASTKDAG